MSGPASGTDFLAGPGEMGEAIERFDWSATPLGNSESWSPALRMMVRFLVASGFPMLLWWGPDYVSIYNDAYRPILGAKHPWALGRPVSEVWDEIWPVLQPLIDTPFHGGAATWDDDILLEINRAGFLEETHFTVAYSAVPDDAVPGGIGGVLATVHEITGKVFADRRVAVLRDLAAHAVDAKTATEACAIAANTLGRHPSDIPFALLYLLSEDDQAAHLVATAGVQLGEQSVAARVPLESGELGAVVSPFVEALLSERPQAMTGLAELSGGRVPAGPWADPPNTAVVLPIASRQPAHPAGFLVAGISSRLALDERYLDFLELVSSQIGTGIANASEHQEERKRAEALAELNHAKTAFFSNVSHEFRTPLTLILGPVDELLERADADDSAQLEVVHRNSLRLLRLVNTMLDFSRLEAGRIEASYQPIDLAVCTAELASVFRSAVERAGLRLVVDCRPLPGPVYVDRDMWEKIVLNLLSNAFKFTLEGEIEVRLDALDGQACLTIRDTGVGIPAQELSRVFERFHRVESTRGRTYEGTGIGLALVHELAQLHGGQVRVESVLGEGSRFIVTIPLGIAHLDPARIEARSDLASTSTGAEAFTEEASRWLTGSAIEESVLGDVPISTVPADEDGHPEQRARVVWADDNADMRDYVARLLADRFEVEPVGDGEAALAAARREPPDLVLADVMMPRLNGIELMHELRSDPELAAVPVILVSARAGEEARIEGVRAGADDYLIKPFSARELLARVESHTRMARLRQATVAADRYRARLADALRALADPTEIQAAAAGMLGEHLHANRAYFVDIGGDGDNLVIERDYSDGVASITGRYRMSDLAPHGEGYRSGRTVVVDDVAADDLSDDQRTAAAALQIRACVGVPIVKEGVLVAILTVCQSERRQWTDAQVALIEETAEWTWAVVEQARAKRALVESEERMRLALQAAGTGSFVWYPDEDRGDLDARMLALFGLSPDSSLNLSEALSSLINPDDRARSGAAVDPSGVRELREEIRVAHPDGSEHCLAISAQVSFDTTPRGTRIAGVATDITDRKRREAKERCLLELADALRPLADPTAIRESASRIIGEHLGVTRAAYGEVEPDGGHITVERDWHRPEIRSTVGRLRIDAFGASVTEPLRTGKTMTVEDALGDPRISPESASAWTNIGVQSAIACPIVKQGRFIAAFFIHHDRPRRWSPEEVELVRAVSDRTWDAVERARAQRALRESEQQLRKALEIETIGVIFFDLSGTITHANEAFLRMGGYTRDDIMQGRLRTDELTPPEWQDPTARAFEELRSMGRSIPYEKECFRRDGSRWPALIAATMLTETHGVKFILDLTDQRAAEAAARQERERRDRLEREFVANAAHELRTPLAAIITSVDALNRGAKDDPLTRERFLGHLQRQSQRLARLSDSLLLLAQAESLHRPERVRFAVRPLLEDVAAELQLPEGVTAHVTAPSTLEVLAHRGLVERIVANLLDNAVKHTAAGRIELRSRATPVGVLIEVRDTGSGISEETRQRSFDRFYRGQARSSDGFGLGLSIAMQAAAALDAEIEITPRRGGGTVARLVLPTNPAADEPVIAAGDVS